MAKTRSRSRKSGASTRAKGTKKSVKRKTAAKRAKRRATPAGLDLKKLRRDIDRAVASLGVRALAAGATPTGETQASLGRLAAEIDAICDRGDCGPSMVI